MIIARHPDIIIRIVRRAPEVPMPRIDEARIQVDVAFAGPTALHVAVTDSNIGSCTRAKHTEWARTIPNDALRHLGLDERDVKKDRAGAAAIAGEGTVGHSERAS